MAPTGETSGPLEKGGLRVHDPTSKVTNPESRSKLCPLCNCDETTRLFESRDRVHNLPGTFAIFRCNRCRAVFIQPWLTDQELAVYYPSHYSGYRHSRSFDRRRYTGLRRFVLDNYYGYPPSNGEIPSLLEKWVAFLLSFVMAKGAIPYRGDGKFLDVGCGGGSYLHRLSQWGWKVYGVEPSQSGVKQARALQLDVFHGELRDAHFPDSFFDVVRLSNVLEHLTDPQETFREIGRILKPDGVVYIIVPNTRSLNFWWFGENWYGLDSPRHVISHSPKTLRYLCEVTGFQIYRIQFRSGAFNFVRSVNYLLGEENKPYFGFLRRINWVKSKIVRRSLKPFFFAVDLIRLGDVMEATLTKST